MIAHETINYLELPAKDMNETKKFYTTVFGWLFTDWGPDYISFDKAGIDGGFYKSDQNTSYEKGSALVILYSKELEQTQAKIETNGGNIVKPIFSFPGGRRFHFTDPNGNELAVWSEAAE